MDLVDVLDHLQLAGFAGVGLAAAWQWRRQRTRPAAYLAGAFALITLALAAIRFAPAGAQDHGWFSVVVLGGLSAFPWLLAAFAWSFEGPLPRWLALAGLGVPALAIWAAALPPLIGADSRTPAHVALLTVFLSLWSLLAAAMAWQLWRAGRGQRLVRTRTRLMSIGALLVTVALLLSAAAGSTVERRIDVATSVLAILAAGLFVAGFAPPYPLRAWWRRRSRRAFQQMQVALIGSTTPEHVAQAVAPPMADLLGGGVAVIGPGGRVLAASQLPEDEAEQIAALLRSSLPLPESSTAFDVAGASLVVRSTAYTPVFGHDEYELLDSFSVQMRLALERAELFRSEQTAREEAQAAKDELESTLYGLSHDLKSPSLAISGFTDLVADASSETEREEMLGHIKASAAYLHQLVDALLELSRIGRTQTRTMPVALEKTVANVARRRAVAHPEATVRVAGRLPTVESNDVRTEQLLDNLIGNALMHAGRPDVAVTVAAERRDDVLELSVSDDGRGIPEADRQRIFELFQRGSTSGSRGSGVGLGMARRIAESCDGTLELADADVGARFVVRLPERMILDDDGADAEPEAIDDPTRTGGA